MGLFRRGAARSAAADDAVTEVEVDVPDEEVLVDPREDDGALVRERDHGPWDVTEVDGLGTRVDLGSIWLPGVVGMELRMEIDKATEVVSAAAVNLEGSALQVQAFAAPRTEGIWDEIREEIAESIVKQGGSADDLPGPFGRELLARLPVRTEEGRTGHRPARFIGADGPRWFLRGVVTGRAAVDPEAARALEGVFADIVVDRGQEARAPRDLLALRLPGQSAPVVPQDPEVRAQASDLDLLRRGPEITEIR
ncbi:MAG TPA: DUF3710 domain-containing protein [Cellulomonadaceae bacterium]|nr:DUF3710 domain-containing protein [Cellulomonadaceae bacterium]